MERAVNTLSGLLKGVGIDGKIDADEITGLQNWIDSYQNLGHLHPFSELLPMLHEALAGGRLTAQDKADMVWLCKQLTRGATLDRISASLQEMQGVLAGVLLDGEVTPEELVGLRDWLQRNQHLRTCWPYDEVDSLVTSILATRHVSDTELELLRDFLTTFLGLEVDHPPTPVMDDVPYSLTGICARDPRIIWQDRIFCLTGNFAERTLVEQIRHRGGFVVADVKPGVDYLVVGSEGNPCWAYACYGRRIEQAIALRKQGLPLVIVHEFDITRALASR
jgi:hypothetical protein